MKQTTATVTCDGCGVEVVERYTTRVNKTKVREDIAEAGWTTTIAKSWPLIKQRPGIRDYCPKCKEAHQ